MNLESRLPLTISAQDGLISQTEFFDKQVASKNISGYYLIENGEFAYNKSYSNGYPWGAIKRLDKYKNGVLSTLYIVFKPIDVDSQFLVSYFDTTFWHSEIAEIAVEGARNHGLLNIPVMDFFRIKIKIPKSKEEQTQIGNFFKQLDDTISLHQREFEKFKILRKAYLKHIFIDNTTQFRAEKTIPWEQRKLGDICNITTGKLDANAMVENGKYDFFTSGIKKYKIDHYAFLGPALTIAGNGATVGYMHYADGFFNAYQRTYVLTELLGDRTFLFSTINRKLQKKIQQEARAGNIPYIVLDMLTELDIYLPSLEEQTQIGNFFKQLDDTISLHQKELAKYQQIKTACLEKMFVE